MKISDSNDFDGVFVKYIDLLVDSVFENIVIYKCNLCEEMF